MDNVAANAARPGEFWTYTLQLPQDRRAVRIARATTRSVLLAYGMAQVSDVAELLASELVTNALRYSDGPAWIRLSNPRTQHVRVGVWDSNPTIPPPFHGASHPTGPPEGAERGRGLLLVRECADRWGGYAVGEEVFGMCGKLLWFELAA
ncbi:ATP-binding protein [Streptomyces sp. SPB162]|uniref:ATP-binding protein n=1 Tax=Streptomyces sp. SPB162 TaxID=2940560 RepID=UPI002406E17A|nr:ATP-binding protein [Streptomyces sp. SPB162]MDF9813651.1 anti-sigma regulatory factor (Ser/Thr protein kinase) [Streptomyces sp. SPB162]